MLETKKTLFFGITEILKVLEKKDDIRMRSARIWYESPYWKKVIFGDKRDFAGSRTASR